MAVYTGNELVYNLVKSLIIANERIYENIPLDKLKEYLMYNVRPYETIKINSDNDISIFSLIGDNHEFDYAIWDDSSNAIIYASQNRQKIIDILKGYGQVIRIEILPKNTVESFGIPFKIRDNVCFHKEYINGSAVYVEDYMPETNELKAVVYSPDNYAGALEDFEEECGERITSQHNGFISIPTKEYGKPWLTIGVRLIEDEGKRYYRVTTIDKDNFESYDKIPYTEGMTAYQIYYDIMVKIKCFTTREKVNKKI